MASSLVFLGLFSLGAILIVHSVVALKDEEDEAFHGRNYLAREKMRRDALRREAIIGTALVAAAFALCFVLTAAGL